MKISWIEALGDEPDCWPFAFTFQPSTNPEMEAMIWREWLALWKPRKEWMQ